MTRLILSLVAWMCLVSSLSATLTPRRESPILPKEIPQPLTPKVSSRSLPQAAEPTPSEYRITHQTEVFLDGKSCRYADIPAHARIVHMEVAADKITVLRVFFRTGR